MKYKLFYTEGSDVREYQYGRICYSLLTLEEEYCLSVKQDIIHGYKNIIYKFKIEKE